MEVLLDLLHWFSQLQLTSALEKRNPTLSLQFMRTYSSLYTDTPSLVKMDVLPSSNIFPTLIRDVGKSSNVSASAAFFDSCGKGNLVTYLLLLPPPFPHLLSFMIWVGWVDPIFVGNFHLYNSNLLLNHTLPSWLCHSFWRSPPLDSLRTWLVFISLLYCVLFCA